MTTLTITQLNTALTNEQITKARETGVADGAEDPALEEIQGAIDKVDSYTAGWIVPAAWLTNLARALAAHNLATRLGKPTTDQVRIFDRANKELEDIRDGKFPNLEKDPDHPGATGKVITGSRKNILPQDKS